MKKSRNQKKLVLKNGLRVKTVVFAAVMLLGLLAGSLSAFAQNTVRGKVTTEAGEPLSGASVQVKGTTTGTTTDDEGTFSIVAARGAVLVVSSVNYAEKEITVGNNANVSVTLSLLNGNLGEVIVVGYGTQRKEAVTGSVASISGDRMREIPAPNISQALQGRLAGVEMSQTSTRPGATMQIRIRGTRSLTGDNNPLIVLDGIPFVGSIADINPNDIKSIDILKDASATAIYGSRGANGVVLITTDKGQKGRRPRVSYNSYVGLQSIFAKFPMMDGPEFTAFRAAAGLYTNQGDEVDGVNTDWQDLFFRDGVVTDHTVSLNGGTETGSYNFGLGYYQNQGVIPTNKYTRYSLRGSLDQQIGKYFSVGFTTNNNYNRTEGNQVGLYGVLSTTPVADPYNPDGTLKRTVRMTVDENYVLTRDVVERLHDQWLSENRGFATYNAIYGEVKIPWVKGLKYRVNLGLDFIQSNNGNYTGVGVNNVNATTVSSAGISNAQTYHWTIENILSYDRTFAQKHNVNVVALYSAERNTYNSSAISARDIPAEEFQFYNLGRALGEIVVDPNNQSYTQRGLLSYMGRIMYSYDNRYMLSATLRSDGASVLAPGHQWHTYPAISAGWNISNESFMASIPWINRLKLRAGYGQTSNQAVNPYSTLGALGSRPYNFGDTYAVGYYVSSSPNPSLGWEFSKTINVGLDFSVLKNRLSGTVEYYVTNTDGILQNVSLPPTSGVGSYVGNVGEVQNKGVEVSLNGIIIDNKNGFTWDAGFNFYTNTNKIVKLASGKDRDEGNGWFVGHNINAIFDYQKIGLWQQHDQNMTLFEPGGNVGMIKVLYTGDFNPDGTPVRAIGAADRQIMDVDPDFQGGFNTRVSYKGFDLSLVGIFRSGGLLISNLHGPNGYLNMMSGRRNNIKVDYWTPDNTDAKYPKPGGIASGDNPKYASTLAYFDGSFLKLRTITLGYDFNHSLIKNSGVRLRMYATIQNPFVMLSSFHKETGLDPETNSYGNDNVATGGYIRRILTVGFNTPSTRNYIVGLNLTF